MAVVVSGRGGGGAAAGGGGGKEESRRVNLSFMNFSLSVSTKYDKIIR